ncbi:MAG: hypothetical protein MUO27_09160 [Sedimentisphaerales bacterium]|nr:hypothetical protein [Sedimentisphaerales bacterium]
MWLLITIYHPPDWPATKNFHENKIKNRFSPSTWFDFAPRFAHRASDFVPIHSIGTTPDKSQGKHHRLLGTGV